MDNNSGAHLLRWQCRLQSNDGMPWKLLQTRAKLDCQHAIKIFSVIVSTNESFVNVRFTWVFLAIPKRRSCETCAQERRQVKNGSSRCNVDTADTGKTRSQARIKYNLCKWQDRWECCHCQIHLSFPCNTQNTRLQNACTKMEMGWKWIVQM